MMGQSKGYVIWKRATGLTGKRLVIMMIEAGKTPGSPGTGAPFSQY